MQWAFTPAAAVPGSGLKRPASSGALQSLVKRPMVAAAAAQQPGSSSNGAAPATALPPLAASPAAAAAAAGAPPVDVQAVAAKHGWDLQQCNDWSEDPRVRWIPVAAIRRPLQGSRSNDPEKVAALMQSIQDIGLQEPIDVLEVDGQYWGFSGCHRFEAHQRLGRETILCRVRKANQQILRFHMM